MRQRFADLIDGCMSRIGNRTHVPPGAIEAEVNHGLEELYSRIRDQRADWLYRQALRNIYAGRDVYDLPDDCPSGNLLSVEFKSTDRWILLVRQTPRQADGVGEVEFPPQSYVAVGNKQIRILFPYEPPTETKVNGLRYSYTAGMTPLVNMEDVPLVPDEVHEYIIVAALDRLRTYPDVKIAQPQEFEVFRQEQTARLVRHLAPQHLDEPPLVGDEDPEFMYL